MGSVMERYHALVRGLVKGQSTSVAASAGALHYRTLVRLQHRQAILQMFAPVVSQLGPSVFERIVDELRRENLPRDPNPLRWARAFADHVATHEDVDSKAQELAEFLATRIEVNLAPDVPYDEGLSPSAQLRAFQRDPRIDFAAPRERERARPVILAIDRDDEGRVRICELDRDAVAAWGLESGAAERDVLAVSGIGEEDIARGRALLVAKGLLRG